MDEKSDKSENDKPEPPDKRRWYQYSLRSLLIFMLVSGFFFAWLGEKIYEARQQRAVVAWVKEKGGEVNYDYEYDANEKWIPNAKPPGPDWLREWIGIDYFSDVNFINLRFKQVTNLSSLVGLTKLEELNLLYTQVTDLSPLEGLTNLKTLYLSETHVSDISPLEGLTNLKTLYLSDTQVSDFSPLSRLTLLEELGLDDTKISDLTPLEGLTNLKKLDLAGTSVKDLSPLEGLTNLEELYLGATFSKEVVERLRKALPNCSIW